MKKKQVLKISSKLKKVRVEWGFKPTTRIVVDKRKKQRNKGVIFDLE